MAPKPTVLQAPCNTCHKRQSRADVPNTDPRPTSLLLPPHTTHNRWQHCWLVPSPAPPACILASHTAHSACIYTEHHRTTATQLLHIYFHELCQELVNTPAGSCANSALAGHRCSFLRPAARRHRKACLSATALHTTATATSYCMMCSVCISGSGHNLAWPPSCWSLHNITAQACHKRLIRVGYSLSAPESASALLTCVKENSPLTTPDHHNVVILTSSPSTAEPELQACFQLQQQLPGSTTFRCSPRHLRHVC